jgi:hypothetical protein
MDTGFWRGVVGPAKHGAGERPGKAQTCERRLEHHNRALRDPRARGGRPESGKGFEGKEAMVRREQWAQSCGEAAASGNSTRACQRLGRRLGRAREAQVFVRGHVNVAGRAQQQYEGGVEERAEVVGEDAAGRARGCSGPDT